MYTYLTIVWTQVRARIEQLRNNPEAGYSTETVVATALLVALALLVVGAIIYQKVVAKANSINLQ